MKNDNLIKHAIISNAHFDSHAKDLVPARTNNYEVYNSVMADTFINLIHNLVQKNLSSSDDEESISQTAIINRSNSSEAMDLSDVSNRTSPSLGATSLSISDILHLSGNVRYEANNDYNAIDQDDTVYTMYSEIIQ